MKFLDGYKTILGALGLAATIVISPEKVGVLVTHADSIATGVFGLLTVLGVIHKKQKASE